MIQGKCHFEDPAEALSFVEACDRGFQAEIDRVVHLCLEKHDCRILTLSGPTCSGKTTTADLLQKHLQDHGKRVHIISIDDFFYGRTHIYKRATEEGKKPDFETVEAIDLPLFVKVVEAIRRGGEVTVPTFDFQTGERGESRVFRADEKDVFLFEGIQAIYPKITEILHTSPCLSLFIEAGEPVRFGDVVFLPPEIRFLRRIVRDHKFRSSDGDFVFQLWEGVRANEDKNIYPYVQYVDCKISSSLGYGINILKKHLVPLLEGVKTPAYRKTAADFLHRMEGIASLPDEILSADSVFHEFVG